MATISTQAAYLHDRELHSAASASSSAAHLKERALLAPLPFLEIAGKLEHPRASSGVSAPQRAFPEALHDEDARRCAPPQARRQSSATRCLISSTSRVVGHDVAKQRHGSAQTAAWRPASDARHRVRRARAPPARSPSSWRRHSRATARNACIALICVSRSTVSARETCGVPPSRSS